MNLNYKKIFLRCSVICVFGILFGWIIFPVILKTIVKKQVVLKKGSQIREMWERTPFPLHFLIYVFNITNPEEFQEGGIPKIEEIGPFYFDEWKMKYDLNDNETEDSISFNMKNTFIFRPDKSNGLTGEEIITLPNILYLSIGIVVKRDRPPLLNLVNGALQIIFPNNNATISAKFMDIFFHGIFIDCSSNEFSSKALCSSFHNDDIKSISPYNQTHFLFSIMGNNNASDGGRFTVCRGIKNIHKLGKIIRYQNEPKMDYWNGDECNKFYGTDSTIFPPFMKKDEGLWAFTPDICRSMGATYINETKYDGLPASKYYLDMGDIQNDEKLHCFCNDPPNNCPLKGTMDLISCVGGPLIASMPHFYNGDSKLFENVIGLNPNKEKHAIFIDFERNSGTPLQAVKRLQFNFDMENVEEIVTMRNLKKIIVPMFWIEEGVSLNKTYVNMLKYSLFLGLTINRVIKWSCLIIGGIGAIISGLLHFKKSKIDIVTSKPMQNNVNGPVTVNDFEN